MIIEFLSNQDGGTVLRRARLKRGHGISLIATPFSPKFSVEYDLFDVSFHALSKIASTYELSDARKAKLAFRLQRCRTRFVAEHISYRTTSYKEVMKQLASMRISVSRIAKLGEPGRRSTKYLGAIALIRRAANQLSTEPEEAPNEAFVATILPDLPPVSGARVAIMRSGLPAMSPLSRTVSKWIADARMVLKVIEEAETILSAHPVGEDGVSPETTLYGYQLPRLYELTTGATFGISRSSNKLNETGGVGFVIAAARAISVDVSASNVESHYRKAQKAGLWKRASRPVKTASVIARET